MNFAYKSTENFCIFATAFSGCGAVGSALRSGRRGRKFESCHPDGTTKKEVTEVTSFFLLGYRIQFSGFKVQVSGYSGAVTLWHSLMKICIFAN